MTQMLRMWFLVPLVWSAACQGDGSGQVDPGGMEPAPGGDAGGDPAQSPPPGKAAVDPWLDAGHYKAWRCESSVMDPRPKGVHGRNRVCSNDLLSAATSTPFPVGAATVKEIFDSQDRPPPLKAASKWCFPHTGSATSRSTPFSPRVVCVCQG